MRYIIKNIDKNQYVRAFLKIFSKCGFALLCYWFLSVYTGAMASERELYVGRNPCTASCFCPSMAEFFHRDNHGKPLVSKQGEVGESILYNTFELYGNLQSEVEIFKSLNTAGTGFDHVMVDKKNKKIVFLEAKETSANMAQKEHIYKPELLDRTEAFETIVSKMKGQLKHTGHDRTDQLSRRWCSNRFRDLRSIYPTYGELFDHTAFGNDNSYRFMRIIGLIFINNGLNSERVPLAAYYSIVKDGNFEDGVELNDGAINGAVHYRLLYSDRELSASDAEDYLHSIYSLLNKQYIEAALPFSARILNVHKTYSERSEEGWSIQMFTGLFNTWKNADDEHRKEVEKLEIACAVDYRLQNGEKEPWKSIAKERSLKPSDVKKNYDNIEILRKTRDDSKEKVLELQRYLPAISLLKDQTLAITNEHDNEPLLQPQYEEEHNNLSVDDQIKEKQEFISAVEEKNTPKKKVYSEQFKREVADEAERRKNERGANKNIADMRGIASNTVIVWHKSFYPKTHVLGDRIIEESTNVQGGSSEAFISNTKEQYVDIPNLDVVNTTKENTDMELAFQLPETEVTIKHVNIDNIMQDIVENQNYRESEDLNNLYKSEEKNKFKRQYSQVFKREVADEAERRKSVRGSISSIAEEKGTTTTSVSSWHKKYYPHSVSIEKEIK